MAGHDTTASSISWTLYSLAEHPDIQHKCREEVDEILQERGDNAEITWLVYAKDYNMLINNMQFLAHFA